MWSSGLFNDGYCNDIIIKNFCVHEHLYCCSVAGNDTWRRSHILFPVCGSADQMAATDCDVAQDINTWNGAYSNKDKHGFSASWWSCICCCCCLLKGLFHCTTTEWHPSWGSSSAPKSKNRHVMVGKHVLKGGWSRRYLDLLLLLFLSKDLVAGTVKQGWLEASWKITAQQFTVVEKMPTQDQKHVSYPSASKVGCRKFKNDWLSKKEEP